MNTETVAYGQETAATDITTAELLGQVMFLVSIALGFLALGSFIGRDVEQSTATICSFVALGMLFASAFIEPLRRGIVGISWLYALALVLGIGLGPTLNHLVTFDPGTVTTAAGGTALTVLAAGAAGFFISKDLAPWMKPLAIVILIACAVGIVLFIAGSTMPPFLSAIILLVSAGLIVVDFNYLRKHGTENDAIWLATGIFVSIVNIFLALLNLLGE